MENDKSINAVIEGLYHSFYKDNIFFIEDTVGTVTDSNKRHRIFQKLYLLGEKVSAISKRTGWSTHAVLYAVKKNKEVTELLSLKKRFCSFCGKEFEPKNVRQLFCKRGCFRKAYYRGHLKEARVYAAKDVNRKKKKVNNIQQVTLTGCRNCGDFFKKETKSQKYCSIKCRNVFNNITRRKKDVSYLIRKRGSHHI